MGNDTSRPHESHLPHLKKKHVHVTNIQEGEEKRILLRHDSDTSVASDTPLDMFSVSSPSPSSSPSIVATKDSSPSSSPLSSSAIIGNSSKTQPLAGLYNRRTGQVYERRTKYVIAHDSDGISQQTSDEKDNDERKKAAHSASSASTTMEPKIVSMKRRTTNDNNSNNNITSKNNYDHDDLYYPGLESQQKTKNKNTGKEKKNDLDSDDDEEREDETKEKRQTKSHKDVNILQRDFKQLALASSTDALLQLCISALRTNDHATAQAILLNKPDILAHKDWEGLFHYGKKHHWRVALYLVPFTGHDNDSDGDYDENGDKDKKKNLRKMPRYDPNKDGKLSPIPDIVGYKSVNVSLILDDGTLFKLPDCHAVLWLHMPARISNVYSVDNGNRIATPGTMVGSQKYYSDAVYVFGVQYVGSEIAIKRILLAYTLGRIQLTSNHDPNFYYALNKLVVEPRAAQATGEGCGGPGLYFFPHFKHAYHYSELPRSVKTPFITKRFSASRGFEIEAPLDEEGFTRSQGEKKLRDIEYWLREKAEFDVLVPPPPAPRPPPPNELARRFRAFLDMLPESSNTSVSPFLGVSSS